MNVTTATNPLFAPPVKSPHDQLVDKTRTWVAQTFFGEMLKQMRNSPFKSELFSGGQGGEMFATMQDQQLAERMTRGAGAKLVNAIVRRIEARSAYAAQKTEGRSLTEGTSSTEGTLDVTPARRP